ncbi:MAG: STAS domain-containing protein [Chlamydiae bacterium]|nr:STAS domain-containing protein [Chlamydiota bacterium]MBI3277780.1 STAS domain-containing protein [Chlamydiota bacterium]
MAKRSEIEILTREVDQAWIVDLGGEIDLYQSPQVRKKFEGVLAKNPKRLLVNLTKVSYMDSSGLATLVEVFQITKKKGIVFGLFGMNTTLKGLFEITRLEKVFSIYPEEAQALKGL